MSLRPCQFVLADQTIETMVVGFLSRPGAFPSLGCRAFDFDPKIDVLVPGGMNDPGLVARARDLARGAHRAAERVVFVLDNDWEGTPGVDGIRSRIMQDCSTEGWDIDRVCVIVLDPEVEVWIWQESPHVREALGFAPGESLRAAVSSAAWPDDAAKPLRPKEALQQLLRARGKPFSKAIHRKIAEGTTIKRCVDPGLQQLREFLQRQFPA